MFIIFSCEIRFDDLRRRVCIDFREINNQARSKKNLSIFKIKVHTFAYLVLHNIRTTRVANLSQMYIYSKLCTRINNDVFTSHGREMKIASNRTFTNSDVCSRFSSHTNRHAYAHAWQHACTHDVRLREEVGGFIFVADASLPPPSPNASPTRSRRTTAQPL